MIFLRDIRVYLDNIPWLRKAAQYTNVGVRKEDTHRAGFEPDPSIIDAKLDCGTDVYSES